MSSGTAKAALFDALASVAQGLGSGRRAEIVDVLAQGERSVEEIATELDCDSLAYLSLGGVYEAIRSTRETHCDACFTGEYPLERTHAANGKFALETVQA